jgi:hypothetical protein
MVGEAVLIRLFLLGIPSESLEDLGMERDSGDGVREIGTFAE